MKISRSIWFSAGILCASLQLASHAQSAATNKWTLLLANYGCDSSPAIATDGTIYQATFDGKLLAITPQGEIKWTFKSPLEINSSPAVADDGTIYFGSRDRKLYAVTPDGTLKWTFPTGAWIDSSPAIGADGTIYFGSWDTNLYALNPDGSKKWIFHTGGIVVSSPAIGADGTIYFGSHDKQFYALKPDGMMRWKFPADGPIISSPAIAADGTICFTSTDGNLYALNPDGTAKWQLHTGGSAESSPVIDKTGNIYVGMNHLNIGVSKDGKKMWERGTAYLVDASAAIATDGTMYAPAPWHELAALERSSGDLHWELRLDSFTKSSPVIGDDGTIYMASGRFLFAVMPTNALPLEKSSWPMFRANPQHTGRVGK
jgi:outer membrane protein assembly factor BamB